MISEANRGWWASMVSGKSRVRTMLAMAGLVVLVAIAGVAPQMALAQKKAALKREF